MRVIVIAFALVIAYPYIPGSDSTAFKGVSVFAGVLLSLGSSSFIANSIAGLSMTYRAAFREGDRIKVGDVVGTVEEIKLMVTKVRTPKNEHVIIPNSNILNDQCHQLLAHGAQGRRDSAHGGRHRLRHPMATGGGDAAAGGRAHRGSQDRTLRPLSCSKRWGTSRSITS